MLRVENVEKFVTICLPTALQDIFECRRVALGGAAGPASSPWLEAETQQAVARGLGLHYLKRRAGGGGERHA